MGAVYKPKDLSKKYRKRISNDSINDIIPEKDESSTENSNEEKG
jgi:hypothetical protein